MNNATKYQNAILASVHLTAMKLKKLPAPSESEVRQLQEYMDKLTPENYVYIYNKILDSKLKRLIRETPVMYLPPLRSFPPGLMTRKNRRNRRNRRKNSRRRAHT